MLAAIETAAEQRPPLVDRAAGRPEIDACAFRVSRQSKNLFPGFAIREGLKLIRLDVVSMLGVQQEKLAEVRGQRLKLQRDIDHMRPGHVDLDLLEQLSREKLMNAAPNQVEISRAPQH